VEKFISRKLLATVLAVLGVIAADLFGAPLDEATMDAVTNMVLGLVGAQGLVDTAAAWKAGTALADVIVSVQEEDDDGRTSTKIADGDADDG